MNKCKYMGAILLGVGVVLAGIRLLEAYIQYTGKFVFISGNATRANDRWPKPLRIAQLENSSYLFTNQPNTNVSCNFSVKLADDYNIQDMTRKGLLSTVSLKVSVTGKEDAGTKESTYIMGYRLKPESLSGRVIVVETLSNGQSRTLTVPLSPQAFLWERAVSVNPAAAGTYYPIFKFSFELPEWNGRPKMGYSGFLQGGTLNPQEMSNGE